MSQMYESDEFYAAGKKLAEHIAYSNGKDIYTATLQALIRDFLPQHEELQEALRSIVARADFLQLVKLAGSKKGNAQKSAFVENLRKIYSAEAVFAADRLISGILGFDELGTQKKLQYETILGKTLSSQSKDFVINPGIRGDESSVGFVRNYQREGDLRKIQEERGGQKLSSLHPSQSLRNLAFMLVVALSTAGIWVNLHKVSPQVLVDSEIRTSDKIKQESTNQSEVPQVLVDPEIRAFDPQTSYKQKGKKFLVEGNYVAAIKELRLAVDSNPNDSDAWGNLGLSYAYLDNYQEAINAYTAGLKSLANRGLTESPDLLEMRGHSFQKTGEYASAISDYTKAIQSKLKKEGNDAANSFAYRAEAYTKAGDSGAATRDKLTADCLYKLAEITNYKNGYQRNLGCLR